MIFKQL